MAKEGKEVEAVLIPKMLLSNLMACIVHARHDKVSYNDVSELLQEAQKTLEGNGLPQAQQEE